MVVHAFNPSCLEAETDRSLRVWGQPGLYIEFQASQSYTVSKTLSLYGNEITTKTSLAQLPADLIQILYISVNVNAVRTSRLKL